MSSGPGPTFCQKPFSQFMAILLSASSSPQPPNVLLGSSDLASPDEDYLYTPHPPAPAHTQDNSRSIYQVVHQLERPELQTAYPGNRDLSVQTLTISLHKKTGGGASRALSTALRIQTLLHHFAS